MENEPPEQILLVLALVLLLLIGFITFTPKTPQEGDKSVITLSECFVRAFNIPYYHIPRTYGSLISDVSDPIILSLIDCESGGNPLAHNKKDPHGGSYGILQFQKSTFQQYCVDKYKLEDDIWNSEIQIKCCEKMLKEGLINHWTCGKNYLTNTF